MAGIFSNGNALPVGAVEQIVGRERRGPAMLDQIRAAASNRTFDAFS
jgi:hypothetical protein